MLNKTKIDELMIEIEAIEEENRLNRVSAKYQKNFRESNNQYFEFLTMADIKSMFDNDHEDHAVIINNWLEGKQRKPSESYKSINMNSSVWSRFMDGQKVTRETTFRVLIGIKANYDTAQKIMKSLGYSFSRGNDLDRTILAHIMKGDYDTQSINETLTITFEQPPFFKETE